MTKVYLSKEETEKYVNRTPSTKPKEVSHVCECPMCCGESFDILIFDRDNHMTDMNTWLRCTSCGYELPLEMYFPNP